MNGWACDERILNALKSDSYDVIMCYDYKDILLPKEVELLFSNYEEVSLIAWSIGVYVGNMVLDYYKDLFTNKIAINGSLSPINNSKGIPESVFQEIVDNLNEENHEKFWSRMYGGRNSYIQFQDNLPKRELEEQKEELITLQSIISSHHISWNIFNIAFIGKKDIIFPPENQKNAWTNSLKLIERNVPHYCFNNWELWDEIIEDLTRDK